MTATGGSWMSEAGEAPEESVVEVALNDNAGRRCRGTCTVVDGLRRAHDEFREVGGARSSTTTCSSVSDAHVANSCRE
jgi:hypothetical protein